MWRLLLVVIALGLGSGCERSSVDKTQVVTHVDAIWNRGDTASIDARYSETIAVELKEMVESSRKFYPDLALTIDPIAVDGDVFFYRWKMVGTHSKYAKKVELRGVTYGRMQDGKVVEEQIYYDRLAEADQLGFMVRSPSEL